MNLDKELARCRERITQARTLDEAVQGHSDMLNLLDIKLSRIRRNSIRDDDRSSVIADILDHMGHHRDAIDRLTDIIEYDHAFIWRPQ